MILDKIENAYLYQGIHKGIDKALMYIESTNFSDLPMGRQEIDGDTIYAIIKAFKTKHLEGELLESHKKYIDVQYVIKGIEQIGVTTLTNQEPKKKYAVTEDYMLFDEEYDIFSLKAGMFAIFFPDDIHLPEITIGEVSLVKKVVVKVKI